MKQILLTGLLLAWGTVAQGGLTVVTTTLDGNLMKLYDSSWAVVIGINQYQKWPPLQAAVNDAQAVREKLLHLGFPPENIIYLTDGQATKVELERILGDELRRKVGENDRVFIYFAGHGQTEDLPDGRQEGYIVPVDGDRSDLFSTCISMTTVRQFSQRMAAKHVFYAIDACYSGLALMRSGELDPGIEGYLNKVTRFPARQLVTAGSAGEQVIEQGGHGAFTKSLLVALDGSADKFEPIGVLTGSELGHYLQPTVSIETNNEQTPQFGRLAAGEGEFLFVLPEVNEPPNTPPIAYAGPDRTVRLQKTVTLDGRQSQDPDGDLLAFDWQQTGGPEVVLTHAQTATPQFTPTQEGVYRFRLVVNDGQAESRPDVITLQGIKPTRRKWLWGVLGASAVGGGGVAVWGSRGGGGSGSSQGDGDSGSSATGGVRIRVEVP